MRPSPVEPEGPRNRRLDTSSVETNSERGNRELPPYELKMPGKQRANASSPPDPKSPMGGPDKKGGITASDMSEIKRLMVDATLFTPDFKAPKNVIVLCHGVYKSCAAKLIDLTACAPLGLYGFSTATPIPLFPSLKLHYWHAVLDVLRDTLGCKVMVVGVKGTGSIEERANQMHQYLEQNLPKGTGVNFVAHSMVSASTFRTHRISLKRNVPFSKGGLDCRYVITHLKPTTYKPLSLTMIGTPNRGSPFMDWCAVSPLRIQYRVPLINDGLRIGQYWSREQQYGQSKGSRQSRCEEQTPALFLEVAAPRPPTRYG